MKLSVILNELKEKLSASAEKNAKVGLEGINNLAEENYNREELAQLLKKLCIGTGGILEPYVFIACVAYFINANAKSLNDDVVLNKPICIGVIKKEIEKLFQFLPEETQTIQAEELENYLKDFDNVETLGEMPESGIWDFLEANNYNKTETNRAVSKKNELTQLQHKLGVLVDIDGLKMGFENFLETLKDKEHAEAKTQGRLITMLDRACQFRKKDIEKYYTSSTYTLLFSFQQPQFNPEPIIQTSSTSFTSKETKSEIEKPEIVQAQVSTYSREETFNTKQEYQEYLELLAFSKEQFEKDQIAKEQEEEEELLPFKRRRIDPESSFTFSPFQSNRDDDEDKNGKQDFGFTQAIFK